MEGHVAFDLLHDLVDVAVEHGDGAEALQEIERACAVIRAPTPFVVDEPERHMREDDDRRRRRLAAQVVFEPDELLVAKIAETAGL